MAENEWIAFLAQNEEFPTFQSVHVWMCCGFVELLVHMYIDILIFSYTYSLRTYICHGAFVIPLSCYFVHFDFVMVLFGTFLTFVHKTSHRPDYIVLCKNSKVHLSNNYRNPASHFESIEIFCCDLLILEICNSEFFCIGPSCNFNISEFKFSVHVRCERQNPEKNIQKSHSMIFFLFPCICVSAENRYLHM